MGPFRAARFLTAAARHSCGCAGRIRRLAPSSRRCQGESTSQADQRYSTGPTACIQNFSWAVLSCP
jgi:hypothetical protein